MKPPPGSPFDKGYAMPPMLPSIVHVSRQVAASVLGNPLFGPSAVNDDLMRMMRMVGLLRHITSPDRQALRNTFGFSRNGMHEKTVQGIASAADPRSPLHSHGTMLLRFVDPMHDVHQRTMLFLPALTGDMLLLLELLRWGAPLDQKDAYGYTPLLACLLYMRVSLMIAGRGPYSNDEAHRAKERSLFGDQIPNRLKAVATVLIEQHCDVNVSADRGTTPLMAACDMGDWDLIELLLSHGATTEPPAAAALFPDSRPGFEGARRRFSGLRSRYPSSDLKRPARLCPCASGRRLSDCHAAPGPHAYPPELYCPCAASGKSYASCCQGKTVWTEYWDAENKVLVARRAPDSPPASRLRIPPAPQMTGWIFTLMETLQMNSKSAPELVGSQRVETVCWGVMTLMEEHKYDIDPGFTKVFRDIMKFPRVASRTDMYPRIPYTYPSMWNYAVDDYCEFSYKRAEGDTRTTRELEIALKVDSEGTPLYKHCGHCQKVEETPTEHKRCSICKQAFYCSAQCQKAAWKQHKPDCKEDSPPRLSDSYELFQATIKEIDRLGMMDWALNLSVP